MDGLLLSEGLAPIRTQAHLPQRQQQQQPALPQSPSDDDEQAEHHNDMQQRISPNPAQGMEVDEEGDANLQRRQVQTQQHGTASNNQQPPLANTAAVQSRSKPGSNVAGVPTKRGSGPIGKALLSPTYKLGKRALMAIQESRGGMHTNQPQAMTNATADTARPVQNSAKRKAVAGNAVSPGAKLEWNASSALDMCIFSPTYQRRQRIDSHSLFTDVLREQPRQPAQGMLCNLPESPTPPRKKPMARISEDQHDDAVMGAPDGASPVMHRTPRSKSRAQPGIFSACRPTMQDDDADEDDFTCGRHDMLVSPEFTALNRREQLGLVKPPALRLPPRQTQDHIAGSDGAGVAVGSTGSAQAAADNSFNSKVDQDHGRTSLRHGHPEHDQHDSDQHPAQLPSSAAPSLVGSGSRGGASAGPTWEAYQTLVEELRSLRQERDQARGVARAKRAALQARDTEIQRLTQGCTYLQRNRDEIMAKLAEVTAQRDQLMNTVNDLNTQIAGLKTDHAMLSEKVSVMAATVEAQQEEHAQLTKQIEKHVSNERRYAQRVNELETRCSTLKRQLRSQHDHVEHLTDLLARAEKEIEQYKAGQLRGGGEVGGGFSGETAPPAGGSRRVGVPTALNFYDVDADMNTPEDGA